jgi:hypothetical protein
MMAMSSGYMALRVLALYLNRSGWQDPGGVPIGAIHQHRMDAR